MKKRIQVNYFSRFELALWFLSVVTIVVSFTCGDTKDYFTLIASLIGATSLILNAKGNVWGQILTVIFSVLYGIISFSNAYYGEMVTYLGMTAPIAIASVVSWIRHPAQEGKNEVKVNQLKLQEYVGLLFMGIMVMVIFYYILKAFNTGELWLSTISVFTSFIASYLTLRRSEYYALGYALNDIVLIYLWLIAMQKDRGYRSVVICFVIFLINDIYGYCSWLRMKKSQAAMYKTEMAE